MLKEAVITQSKLARATKRQQQHKIRTHSSPIHIDISKRKKSKTIEKLDLATDLSAKIPARNPTSSSPKDFMHAKTSPRRHMDKIDNKIRANKQEQSDKKSSQFKKSDSKTDYASSPSKNQNQKPRKKTKTTTQNNPLQSHNHNTHLHPYYKKKNGRKMLSMIQHQISTKNQ